MAELPDQPKDARARLGPHFAAKDISDHPKGWDELWVEGYIPCKSEVVSFICSQEDLFIGMALKTLSQLVKLTVRI